MEDHNTTKNILNRILRELAVCYMLFIMPAMIVMIGLITLTELRGRMLLISFLPAAAILVVIYLIRVFRPVGFIRFWIGRRYIEEHSASKKTRV